MSEILLRSLIALREHLHVRLRAAVSPGDHALIDDGLLLCETAIGDVVGRAPDLDALRARGLLGPLDGKLPTRFFHGTRAALKPGDLIEPGHPSNFGPQDPATWVYLTGTLDAAIWGAELAVGEGPERIYVVEPTGALTPDPNLTKGGGNPTESYRSQAPLRVTEEHTGWTGHPPESVKAMKARISQAGLKPLDD